MTKVKINRALISVSDKTEIINIASRLAKGGCEIISTGGTARKLKEARINTIDIQTVTGNPEAFDGRMKTISFQVESALLYDRQKDAQEAKSLNITPIDLVICNLYPFAQKVDEGAMMPELIDNIDIGGPTMIRAAAKNFQWVTVITDPQDYQLLIKELDDHQDSTTEEFRFKMMRKAFNHTADYDAMIAEAMDKRAGEASLRLAFQDGITLRYGENSHQTALLYRQKYVNSSLADLEYIHGKQLSYNNILDIEAALIAVSDIKESAAAVIKHSNACGFAAGKNQLQVLKNAWFGDPVSAFGSIISFNKILEYDTVKFLELNNKDKSKRKFIEVIAAPDFTLDALEYLTFHKNLRIIRFDPARLKREKDYRFVYGALLVQDSDTQLLSELKQVTQLDSLLSMDEELIKFGLRAVRNIKSNAIVIVQKTSEGIMRLTGMGAGQPNRLISIQLAIDKTRQNLVLEASAGGVEDIPGYISNQMTNCLLISDAYFPFPDNIELAAESGIKTIIQPGGSIKDKQVLKRAEELGIRMIFSGMRHFRH